MGKLAGLVVVSAVLLSMLVVSIPSASAGIIGCPTGFDTIHNILDLPEACLRIVNQDGSHPPFVLGDNPTFWFCADFHDIALVDDFPTKLGGRDGPPVIVSPGGDEYLATVGVTYPLFIPKGTCGTLTGDNFAGFVGFNQAGDWFLSGDMISFIEDNFNHAAIVAQQNQLVPIAAFFDVSFNVLPESPIGVVALVGASLGGLGAFAALRRGNKPAI